MPISSLFSTLIFLLCNRMQSAISEGISDLIFHSKYQGHSSTDCIWSYFCDPPSPLQECLVRICKYCYYTLLWVSHYLTVQDKLNCRLLRIKYQQNREELKISCHLTTSILETMKAQKGRRQGIKSTLTSVRRQKEQNSSSGELRCPKFFSLAWQWASVSHWFLHRIIPAEQLSMRFHL